MCILYAVKKGELCEIDEGGSLYTEQFIQFV